METPQKVLRNKCFDNLIQNATPLKVPASPMLKQLGYGTGINVYKLDRSPRNGELRSPWAIKRITKRIKDHDNTDVYNERLKTEADVLRQLKHSNIVGFRAVLTAKDGKENLVLECCNTSLFDILENRHEDTLGALPANLTLKMSLDVAKGLEYLHNVAKILHGDMKSGNILVKGDFEICKICDFGVSLSLNEQGMVDANKYIGTDLWSAPETIDGGSITDKSDIFSFGLVVYETIALVPPHTLSLVNDSTDSTEDDESSDPISHLIGTRPPLPNEFELTEEYNKVIGLFYVCTNQEPEDRPSAHGLVKALSD